MGEMKEPLAVLLGAEGSGELGGQLRPIATVEERLAWVERAIAHKVLDIWIHQGTDTDEARVLAEKAGVRLRTGTCAVMYVTGGFHVLHKLINKLLGKY